jgi:predicted nuclease with TOPRIM domain
MTVGIKGIKSTFAEFEGHLDWFIEEHQELIDTIKENEIEINRLHEVISELKAQLDE